MAKRRSSEAVIKQWFYVALQGTEGLDVQSLPPSVVFDALLSVIWNRRRQLGGLSSAADFGDALGEGVAALLTDQLWLQRTAGQPKPRLVGDEIAVDVPLPERQRERPGFKKIAP